MYDTNSQLITQTTATASVTGSGFDLKYGTPKYGLVARMTVPTFISATAGSTFTPSIQHSTDNTAYTTLVTGDALTGGTAAVTTQAPIFMPFITNKRYVRGVLTVVSSGGPSIVFGMELGFAQP